MAGLNLWHGIGHIGKDPEIRTLDGGAKVANFQVATTESYKDKDGVRQKKTEWHNIVAWRGLADICEKYLKKGLMVYVEGKLTTRSYEKEGSKRYITEIVAQSFQILTPKGSGNSSESPSSSANSNETFGSGSNVSDDLPF